MVEKRSCPRFQFNGTAQIALVTDDVPLTIHATAADISFRGLQLESTIKINKNIECQVTVFDKTNEVLLSEGKVVWSDYSNGTCRFGVKFHDHNSACKQLAWYYQSQQHK
jgi:hypothetical protein